MRHFNKAIVASFIVGCACAGVFMMLLGSDEPAETRSEYTTQVIPLIGGTALMFSVTDHAKQKTFIYGMPTKRDDNESPLLFQVDLTSAGQPQLVIKPGNAE